MRALHCIQTITCLYTLARKLLSKNGLERDTNVFVVMTNAI